MNLVCNNFTLVELLDFVEIKEQLYNLGLNKSNECISNIYNSFLEQNCEKTRNIIKILGLRNEKIGETIKGCLGNLSASELTKILTLKGIKKAEINQVIEMFKLS